MELVESGKVKMAYYTRRKTYCGVLLCFVAWADAVGPTVEQPPARRSSYCVPLEAGEKMCLPAFEPLSSMPGVDELRVLCSPDKIVPFCTASASAKIEESIEV